MNAGKTALWCLLSVVVWIGCGDDNRGELAIDPSSLSVMVGEDATVSARRGAAELGSATWASSNEAVARVTAAGGTATVHGVAPGTASITATVDGVTATATVTVIPSALLSIALTPPMPSIAAGTSTQLAATGMFHNGTTADLTGMVTWSSASTSVATVDASGKLTGVAVGTSAISATLGQVTGTVTVTVTAARLIAIDVTPPSPSLARGTTAQLAATGRFTNNTTQDLTAQVTWSSATQTVATVSGTGLVTAVNVGTSMVTASMGAISGSVTVTVTPATLASIQVTPVNPSIARGLTKQFTATGTFTDNTTQDLTTMVTWTSGTPATATISNAAGSQGLATAVNVGTTVITATSGAVSGSTTLTVTPASLVSIQVTPVNPSIARGLTKQLTATGTFTDSTTQDLTTMVTWTSGTPATATISNAAGSQGLATAANVGTTVITATSGAVSGSTTLTVTPATLVSIAVSPAGATLALGTTQQYTATGTFSDATTQNLTTSVTWASSNAAVAQISNAAGSEGLATATGVGTASVSATSGTITGSTNVTVTAATLVSIAVTPADASIPNGLAQQYVATGTYSDMTTQDLTTTVTWSSSNAAVAQISNAAGTEGLAQSTGVGTTTISAISGTITDSTTLTVTPAELASIAVTPQAPTIDAGATVQLTAIGTFTDATTADLTAMVVWTSQAPAIATVSATGLVTGLRVGAAQIDAAAGAIVGSTTVTVTAVAPTVVATTPADSAMATVSSLTSITVSFDRAMDPATLVAQASAGPCTGTIQISHDGFASCIGLGAVVTSMGDQVATTTPSPALVFGWTYKIRVTTGAQSSVGAPLASTFTQATGFTTRLDARCATGLVISQVYGGGGNVGAPLTNDFIELHNPTTAPINLAGLAVQYAAAAGMTWQVTPLPSVMLAPGAFFLIQEGGGTTGVPLPPPDATGTILMALGNGKVALTSTTTALSGACPTGASILDLVGYGTASCSETAPTAALSNTTSAQRGNGGCGDDGNNSTDFLVAAPAPRNTSNVQTCACTANETGAGYELDFCNLQFPASTSTAAGALTEFVYGRAFEAGVTEAGGPNPLVRAEIGVGPVTANPQNQPGWSWAPASYNVQVGNDDEYKLQITAPATPGTYRYTARFSIDGLYWTYCDLDGAGSNVGLFFDPARLGTLTVTP